MTRPSLSLALALALPQVQDTSFLHGIDLASQSVLRSETGAYLGGLTTLGSTGAMVEALDFDAAGRDLWAVARDGAGVDVGTLDLGTGAFTRRGGAPIVGAVTDLASAPDGRTWYVAERSGGDAVVWRGELPNADLQPWVTLAGSGPLAGLSVTDTGRVVACEGASGVLVELDAVSGARTVLSTLNTNGDLPLGMDFDWATGELFAVLGPTSPRFATIHLATGAAATVADLAGIPERPRVALRRGSRTVSTTPYCSPAVPNSTGNPARITAVGDNAVERGDLRLVAGSMPAHSFGLFLTSFDIGPPVTPGGALGSLCLTGAVGRLGRGSQLLATGNGGTFTCPLDLRAFPQPLGAVAVEGWRSLYFQGWFRDVMGGASTSNFTAAMRVDVTGTFVDTVFSDPAVPSNQGVSDHLIDFDADGFVDVVRMRRLPNVLEVRRNEGGLRFGELESFPLPSPQFKFDLADFDGDGDVDLLGANPGAFTVHWNEGAAGFVADAPLMTCGSLGPIRAADLDRDGRADLIWACNTGQRLLVFFNEGLRVFSAAQAIPLPANPQHMELADVDGDSQLDIVVASENATLHVVHNLGARVFAPSALSVTSGPAVALDVSDIDGDGDVDFATVEEATGRVTVSLNVAGHVASAVVLETGDVAHGVAIGDVDGDGVADIAVTGNEEAAVRVLRGLGGTAFMPPTVHPAGLNPSELTLLDLDHDGDDEAFVRNDRSYFTSILVGGPLGYAGYPPQYAAPVLTPLFQNEPASPLVAGDFDEDGDIDLIAGSVFGPFVLLTNRGDGTFQPHTPIPVPTGADHARVADLDADGHLDLAVVASTTGRVVRAYLGDGTGHFIAGPETPYLSNDPDDMAVADVNGDGHLDIAFPDFGQVVFHGDGTGAFAALTRHSDISDRWLSLAYGDLDGDGLLDAVGGRRSAGTLVVMYGNAPGSFDPPVVIGLAKDSVLVEDFDADGRLDLAGLGNGLCSVYRNVGSRAFVLTQALTGISQETAAAADLNGDGLPEIVSTMDYGARFTVAHNEGFGELSLRELFGQGDFPGAFALEDLDGDGTRDLAVLDDAKGKVTVYLNRAR